LWCRTAKKFIHIYFIEKFIPKVVSEFCPTREPATKMYTQIGLLTCNFLFTASL